MNKCAWALMVLAAVFLEGCGGGGGSSSNSSTGPVASSLSFPLKNAYVSSISARSIQDISVSGTCSGSGRQITEPATTTSNFEGAGSLSAVTTLSLTLSGCSPSFIYQTITSYFDASLLPVGSSNTADNSYIVYQATPTLPTTVNVGSSGTFGTQLIYTNSTKATSKGSAIQTYVIEADTASTAIVNLITKLYDPTGKLTATAQNRYRISMTGPGVRIEEDVLYANGVHLVLKYSQSIPTSVLIMPTITTSPASIGIGSSANFRAIGTYSGGEKVNISDSVTWSSSNTSTSTINSNGWVLGLGVGSTTISASYNGVISNKESLMVTSPTGPSDVLLTSGLGNVSVTWSPVNNATSYNIYWSAVSGVNVTSAKIIGATSPYVHTGLASGSAYYYRVSTVSSTGESLSSEKQTFVYASGNPSGIFVASGNMLTTRIGHFATLLPSGNVLISGGYDLSWLPLKTVEIYDPTSGVFTATGSMSAARLGGSVTLLPNGKVLFTGGDYITSVEIYDPLSGIFSLMGSTLFNRSEHTSTLLPNGKVLIAGGGTASLNWSEITAEIYDPSTGTSTRTGNMTISRRNHVATLLPNGKVLITGGQRLDPSTSSYIVRVEDTSEVYDPVTGLFTVTGNMTAQRRSHTSILLPSGKVLVTNGYDANNASPAVANIYDPTTGVFSSISGLEGAPVLLFNGKVLLVAGFGANVYDPTSGLIAPSPGLTPNYFFNGTTTLLPNGKVLVTGYAVLSGNQIGPYVNSTYLYQ